MAVLSSDIKLYTSINAGLGGAITGVEIVTNVLNNLFDDVSAIESRDGSVEYRCFYVRNTSATDTLISGLIEIVSDTANVNTLIEIGIGNATVNGVEQTIVSENVPPIGVTFTATEGVQLLLSAGGGELAPNAYKGIWIRRTVTGGAVATTNDTAVLRVTGGTVV